MMPAKIYRRVLLFVFINLFTLTATVSAELIKLNKSQFHEAFNKNVKISGSVRAGVMYSSSLPNVTPDALYIDIDSETDQMLCVSMNSIDGQYGAEFTYQLNAKNRGLTQFELPTELQEEISNYTPDHLVVLAEIKLACKGRNGHIAPASWGAPQTQDSIKVFLNSGGSTTSLKLYKIAGGNHKLPCTSIKAERSTAYDTECNIESTSHYNLKKTKIRRSNFGDYSDPIKLSIYNSQSHLQH